MEHFCKLNKTPRDGTCLGQPPGSFFDVGCCCFTSVEVFTFPSYFFMSLALHPGFSGPWRPPPALSSTMTTFGCFTFARLFRHNLTASATVVSGHFLPTGVFYLALFPHIFARFYDSDAGQDHRIQDPPLSLPSQSFLTHGIDLLTHGLELLIL